jgi:hypothetical protein
VVVLGRVVVVDGAVVVVDGVVVVVVRWHGGLDCEAAARPGAKARLRRVAAEATRMDACSVMCRLLRFIVVLQIRA